MKQLNISQGKITSYNENSFKTYMREINEIPLMTPDEEFKVGMEACSGNKEALDYLISANLRFVISVAKQYVDKKNTIEDLVNEGNFGLVTAAKKFDPTRGFKFISYGVWWVRRAIQEYKNGTNDFIRKPSNRVIALNKYREIKNKLESVLEREPTKEEILESMVGFDNLNIITILEHQEVCSLDKELGEDGFSLKDTIFEISNQEVKDGKADSKYKIDNLLGKIKPREKMVIEMSYGLTGQQPMTLQEIGDIIGLTREAVRQIKTKALYKLKINVGRFNISFDDFE